MVKFFVFAFIFLVIVPGGAIIARVKPLFRNVFFYAMIFCTCLQLAINIAPLPEWRGSSRGFALTLMDIMMLISLFGMAGSRERRFRLWMPGLSSYVLYYLFSWMGFFVASNKQAAGFEICKMTMLLLFVLTCYNFFVQERNFWPLIYTVVGILGFMLLVGLRQKYLQGMYQIPCTLPHQNSVALYCTVFGCMLLGVLLNETMTRMQLYTAIGGFGISTILILFTLSRGGLVCYLLGISLTMVSSLLLNGFSTRKVRIIAVMAAIALVPAVVAAPRVIQRFLYAPESSGQTRINLAHAAVRMAQANTFGVGLNNFSLMSGPDQDYNYEHYEGMSEEALEDRVGGIVETIYLLVAAECGWGGLVALLLWFMTIYLMNVRNLFAFRMSPCFGLAAGLFGGLSANFLQSALEWSLKQTNNFAQIMLVFAVIAAMKKFRPGKKNRRSS